VKRFRFTLQALGVLRDQQKRIAEESYAVALARQHQAASELSAIQYQIQQSECAWNDRMRAGVFRGDEALSVRRHLNVLEEFRKHRSSSLLSANQAVAAAMQAMVRAHQACEAVSKFKDQQQARHLREVGREEFKQMDELAARGRYAESLTSVRRQAHD
jgi:flagellar export protein FliJ